MLPTGSADYPFRDIDPTHWAYRSLKSLYDAGIIKGDGTGLFKGNEKISRFEAASMVNNAMQYMSRMRSTGGGFDPDMMDTMNALMTEFADEMMIMEVRIEENSNAIAAIRNQLSYMHGRPNQGISVPLGQQGRLRIMGQAQFSYVMGGKDHHTYSTDKNVNDPAAPNTAEGVSEFLVDYGALGFAADIDPKTSFYTRANIHMGGDSTRQDRQIMNRWAPTIDITTPDPNTPRSGFAFDDYMYFHVKNIWSDWDMSLGRIGTPWGHETAGMFRTNPYFVTNSMVHESFSGLMDGAYFSKEARSGELYYGLGLHNGDLRPNAEYYWSHSYNTGFSDVAGLYNLNYSPMHVSSYARNLNGSGSGANRDNGHGYVAHIGGRTRDGDLKWDLSYFSNGSSLKYDAVTGNFAGHSAISFINLGADYRINRDWHMSLEYVTGEVEAAGTVTAGNRAAPGGVADAVVDDEYTSWYTQFVHHLDVKSTLALRYGVFDLKRKVPAGDGAVDDSVKELTMSYGRGVSDNGRMILEYSKPTVDKDYGATVANNPKSDVMRATYRMDF